MIDDKPPIIGFKGGGKGGGGGGGRTPVEYPDTLRSRSYARILDLLGEGEMEGPAKPGLQWLYFDGTPVENPDGSFNFTGVSVTTRNGTQAQTHIPGIPGPEQPHQVNVEVTSSTPIVRTVSDSAIDAVRVTLSIPALADTNTSNGDTAGTSVAIAIDVQEDGGSYVEVKTDTITGKASSKYQRSYMIALTGTGPWNIRMRRLTPDSGRQTLLNQTWWESYDEVINAKLRYPNSALVATIIDSEQFSNIPVRGFDWKLLRTQIPSNATVQSDGRLTYSGTWDGTFQIGWHANPAWAFWDMVTESRYGLGDYVPAELMDKWALYEIGRYCDELVDDGFGGQEARFSCNLYMQTQEDAYKVLQDMASIFRGMAYWSEGLVTASQDAPSDVMALYTNANVIGGEFIYAGGSLSARHTVALITWNDPADFYARTVEYVADTAAIARYGYRETSKIAIGCTSRGQAHRVGEWILYCEEYESETVTFRVGLDGLRARPGQIIHVADGDRAGKRYGGRITGGASVGAVTLDKAFTPTPSVSYILEIMMPDGTVATAPIASFAGAALTLGSNLPAIPQANAIFAISSAELQPQTFRILAIVEAQNGEFEITALAHNPGKYDAVESGLVLDPVTTSLLGTAPDAPQNLVVTESLYSSSGIVRVMISISWDAAPRAQDYTVRWRRNDGNLVTIEGVTAAFCEIRDALPGDYDFTVSARSITNKVSPPAPTSKTILGKTALPGSVMNFSIAGISDGVAQLTWAQSSDLDVQIGGFVRLRHTPAQDADSDDWTSSIDISPALPGTVTTAAVPLKTGTYLAKFVDSSGNPSAEASVANVSLAALEQLNIVETITESSTFPGTKTNLVVSGGTLTIDDLEVIEEDAGLLDQLNFLNAESVMASGIYEFESSDLGAAYPCKVTAEMEIAGLDLADFFDSLELFDSLQMFDGNAVDDVGAYLFISTTQNDPSGSPSYAPYQLFHIGQYLMRHAKFKLMLTTNSATHNITVGRLEVGIDMPDRVEAESNISTGGSALDVSYPVPFKAPPVVSITPLALGTGNHFELTNETEEGFRITFKNSGGTVINKAFNYSSKGHGYRV